MFGQRVRDGRERLGLTQAELAARAGVSRQLVGAVEAGRQLPRVDAAAGLAAALDTSVEALLAGGPTEVLGVDGRHLPVGAMVRLGRVGDRLVGTVVASAGEGWDVADGLVGDDGVEVLPGAAPGAVVVGCDPALALADRLLGQRRGPRAMAVAVSSAQAIEALATGRAHAALVHGAPTSLPDPPVRVRRWRLARWRVGLATAEPEGQRWWRDALAGRVEVVQREPGAAAQTTFEIAVAAAGGASPPGPRARGHVEAAQRAQRDGLVALTIEPAAIAEGLAFHPLEEHEGELWVAAEHVDAPGVAAFADVIVSAGFRRRVEAVGGYDLSAIGEEVAA